MRFVLVLLFVPLLTVSRSFAQESLFAIENARVVVGNGEVMDDVVVVIKGERITHIGKFAVPGGVEKIDAQGMTVMPGLIDAHVHLLVGAAINGEASARRFLESGLPGNLEKFLSSGVTTIKSPSDPVDMMIPVREKLAKGELKGPRLLVVGPAFTATGGHPASTLCKSDPWCAEQIAAQVDNPEEAIAVVASLVEKKVDALKLVYDGGKIGRARLKEEVMKAIIEEGHRNGLRVTAHTKTQEDAVEALNAGVDGLEHGVFVGEIVGNEIGSLMKRSGAFYVATLAVWNRGGPERVKDPMANLKLLHGRGVKVAVGTDTYGSMEPGVTTIQELELMAEAGLSPADIIAAATLNGAVHLGLAEDLGTVEAGKIADLLIVDGDPLEDISALRKVKVVLQSGRVVHEVD